MKSRLLSIIIILVSKVLLYSQLDTNFVKKFPNLITASIHISSKNTGFSFNPKEKENSEEANSVSFISNRDISVGFKVSYKDLFVKYSVSLPFGVFSFKNFGNSSSTDFQIEYSHENWLVGGHYYRYEGYTDISDYDDDKGDKTAKANLYRSDIVSQYYESDFKYFFTNKLSYNSTFKSKYVQKRSAYSIFMALKINQLSIKGDSTLISGEFASGFSNYKDIKKITTSGVSTKFGVIGIFVWRKFFVAALVGGGISSRQEYFASNQKTSSQFCFTPNAEALLSLGYNSKQYYITLSNADSFYLSEFGEKISFINFHYQIALNFGLRFDICKK